MKRFVLAAAVCLAAVVLPSVPSQAGQLGNPHNINLEKVLVGGGDPATEFTIVVTCVITDGGEVNDETTEVSVDEPGLVQLGNEAQTCTLSEPDAQGAQASFACSADDEDAGDAVCVAPNVVEFTQSGVPDGQGMATITITNTFGVTPPTDPPPTTPTTDPPPTTGATTAGPAVASNATPSFTG
jgi:hypothetical protein